MVTVLAEHEARTNPLDLLEEIVVANDWAFNRASESELVAQVNGRWCDYHLCFVWQFETSAMLFSCHFDHKVPETKRGTVHNLLAAINETLWLGHFDLTAGDGSPMFRHTIPMRGAPGLSVEQLEDVVDTAVLGCDQFYPALQLVVWGGRSVREAMTIVMMETVGKA